MLLAALLPWPYGYYNFLRFCVCGVAAFLAYQQWTHDNVASKWVVVLIAIALLYNPFVPVYLTREIWSVLNIGTAIALVGHYRSLRRLFRETVENSNSPQIGLTRSRWTLVREGSHTLSPCFQQSVGASAYSNSATAEDERRERNP